MIIESRLQEIKIQLGHEISRTVKTGAGVSDACGSTPSRTSTVPSTGINHEKKAEH